MGNQEVLKLSFEIISRKLKWNFLKNLGTIFGTLLPRMSKNTLWKASKYGVFPGPNTEKYGPEKTPYLDTFHAVKTKKIVFLQFLRNIIS